MSGNIETGSSFEDRINHSFAKGIGGNKRAIDQIIRVAEKGESELNNPRNFDEVKSRNESNIVKPQITANSKKINDEEAQR